MRSVVRYVYLPLMLVGLNGLALWVVAGGHSYAWMGAILLAALTLSHMAEHAAPVHHEWNHDHGDTTANMLHAAVYESTNVLATLLLPVIAWLTPWDGAWPTHWPLFAQLFAAVAIADFGMTIVHWLSHRIPLLWRLHAIHHGVPRMYGLNGVVRHPLHQGLDVVLATGPLAVLGMPMDVAVLLGVAISIQLIVQHSNVAYALGPLRNHLSLGSIHHLHHVNCGKDGDCNFGLFLTLWDKLLGTFVPEPRRPIRADDLGVDELPNFPVSSYAKQLALPFAYTPGLGEPEQYRQAPSPGLQPAKTRGSRS